MTLHGIGEPKATELQRVTQALRIGLYTQWQTYNNGVHMTDAQFNAIDFEALARTFLTSVSIIDAVNQLESALLLMNDKLPDPMDGDTTGSIEYMYLARRAWSVSDMVWNAALSDLATLTAERRELFGFDTRVSTMDVAARAEQRAAMSAGTAGDMQRPAAVVYSRAADIASAIKNRRAEGRD